MPGQKASPETWDESQPMERCFLPAYGPPVERGESRMNARMGLQEATSQGHIYMKEKLKANYGYSSACGSNLSFKDGVPVSPRRLDI